MHKFSLSFPPINHSNEVNSPRTLLALFQDLHLLVALTCGHSRLAFLAAKEIAQQPVTSTPTVYHCDWYPMFRKAIFSQWQHDWIENSYRHPSQIQSSNPPALVHLLTSKSSHRIILCRLQTGYCRLTHDHLMKKLAAPQFNYCYVPLKVDRFLIHCPKFTRYDTILGASVPTLQLNQFYTTIPLTFWLLSTF